MLVAIALLTAWAIVPRRDIDVDMLQGGKQEEADLSDPTRTRYRGSYARTHSSNPFGTTAATEGSLVPQSRRREAGEEAY